MVLEFMLEVLLKKIGTMVIKEESKIEKEIVTGITSSEKDAKIH